MAGVNKVILIGNLGRDPDTRHTQSGKEVCQLSIATTRTWRAQSGDRGEETEWHRVTAWGKLAELCRQHLTKGRQVYVEGRLRTTKYEREGQTHYSTEIVAETVQFIGPKPDGQSNGQSNSGPPPGAPMGGYGPGPGDDDIPF